MMKARRGRLIFKCIRVHDIQDEQLLCDPWKFTNVLYSKTAERNGKFPGSNCESQDDDDTVSDKFSIGRSSFEYLSRHRFENDATDPSDATNTF